MKILLKKKVCGFREQCTNPLTATGRSWSFQLHPNVHLVAFAFTQLLGNCYVSIRINSTIIFRLFYIKNLLFLFYIPTSQNSLFLTDMVTRQDGFLLMSTLSIVKFSVLVNKPPTGIFSMIGVWVKGIVGATWGI